MDLHTLLYNAAFAFAPGEKAKADTTSSVININKLYNTAYDWILYEGPKIVVGLIVLFVGLWLIKLLKRRMRSHMTRKEIHSSLQPFFLSLTITALNVLLVISVMGIIGIELTIFTAVVGAFGVAAGLALSGTLQNFAGGVLILLLKPFEIDDHIIAQGQDGRVQSIQIFFTEVLTADNKTVIIPNGKLFNEVITNITREGKRRLDIDFKLNYVVEIEQVKTIIEKAMKEIPNILPEPATRIGVLALEADGMKFTVRVWVSPTYYLRTKLDLQEKLINDLKAGGIKLPGMA